MFGSREKTAADEGDATANTHPWFFFALVVVLSLPFWVIASVTGLQLAPGAPLSALSAFCPMLAAAILRYRAEGRAGVAAFLARAVDYDRVGDRRWYFVLVLLMPAVMTTSCFVMRASGLSLPAPVISVSATTGLFAASLALGIGEELGWTGYALAPLQYRWRALPAAVLLGFVWAAWHVVPLLQAHRSAEWIAWWWLGTMAQRVVMVWLFNAAGPSVFGVSLYHAMINVTWLLFPIMGSFYDPKVTGLIVLTIAVAVIVRTGARLGYRLFREPSREVA